MPTRRDLFRLASVGAASLALPGLRRPAVAAQSADFSVAFLSDPHVYDEKGAADGFGLAVDHAFSNGRAPELVITGGDLAFDVLKTDEKAADAQYDLFEAPLRSLRVPIHHTLGNHDCFGVYEESGVSPDHRLYGKKYFLKRFGLERPYYSFDHEGWHFVVLDTVGIVGRAYRGWVDAEQLAWLDDDLAAASRPTVVIGHIPLFSHYQTWNQGTVEPIGDRLAVVNSHEVVEVLLRHPVKLVLAGHVHINETFRFKGIDFANVGAISGDWWNGLRDGFEEGYTRLDFRGGEVSWSYVDFGWEARVVADDAA